MEIGRTKNGVRVVIPKDVMKHLEAHPDVNIGHIAEAVRNIEYTGGFLKECVDMGRTVGLCACVELGDEDRVRYFYRKNRKGKTPVVFDRVPKETNNIVIILRELKPTNDHLDGACALITAYYGDLSPMEPWDARMKNMSDDYIKECDEFWSTHALIFDESTIDWRR